IEARQAGDGNYNPATAVQRTLVVNAELPSVPSSPPVVTVPPVSPQPPTTPSINLGTPQFGVGSDASPTVRFFNPDGSLRFSRNPFGNEPVGVRTATGDFNRDGVADLVVGTGPGGPTQVQVLDGVTGAVLFSIAPFEAAFTGGVYVTTGDISGDHVPELIITPDEGGGPRVRVFDGNGFGLLADFFGIDDPNFRGGARPTVADFDGDGIGDLVVAAGFGGGPRVAIFSGTSIVSGQPRRLTGDFFAFEDTLRNGAFVSAGDIDGDGRADLVAGGGPGGGPRITIFSGDALLSGRQEPLCNFFAGNTENRGGVRVAVKDLDGDTQADLIVGDGTGAGSHVSAYRGANLLSGSPRPLFEFDALPGLNGGVFVG
ncbi:MAG: VCBS repeat-containing protein, partial [Bacteroidales bacterium]|nr:VCBS repeat-containing protein [Bacteroidales bacterium]